MLNPPRGTAGEPLEPCAWTTSGSPPWNLREHRKGPTVGQLSRVVQFRGSAPRTVPVSIPKAIGLLPESPSTLFRNRRPFCTVSQVLGSSSAAEAVDTDFAGETGSGGTSLDDLKGSGLRHRLGEEGIVARTRRERGAWPGRKGRRAPAWRGVRHASRGRRATLSAYRWRKAGARGGRCRGESCIKDVMLRLATLSRNSSRTPKETAAGLLLAGFADCDGNFRLRTMSEIRPLFRTRMRVDKQVLLEFFDERVEGSRGHATAITQVGGEDLAAGLFVHYIKSKGGSATILPCPCTQGTRRGSRLDRWIRTETSEETVLYQTEIKSWSAHATDGRTLAIQAADADLRNYLTNEWHKEWGDGTFHKDSVRKVLTPMNPPIADIEVRPLVCYWKALHPEGCLEPMFSQDVLGGCFPHVWIFSLSVYLRTLTDRFLDMELPNVEDRTSWLRRMFSA